MMKRWSPLLIILFFSSCSSTQKHPLNHFVLPESMGAQGEHFEMQYASAKKVYPTSDLRAENLDHQKSMKETRALGLRAAHGLMETVDLELSAGMNQEVYTGIKAQLWGAPIKSAGQGSFSVAAAIGYGIYVTADELGSEDLHNTAQEPRMFIINSGTLHYDVVFGYRFLAPWLFYLGHHWSKASYTLKMKEGLRDTLKYKTRNDGFYVGSLYNLGPWTLHLNMSYSDFSLVGYEDDKGNLSLGFAFGVLF